VDRLNKSRKKKHVETNTFTVSPAMTLMDYASAEGDPVFSRFSETRSVSATITTT